MNLESIKIKQHPDKPFLQEINEVIKESRQRLLAAKQRLAIERDSQKPLSLVNENTKSVFDQGKTRLQKLLNKSPSYLVQKN